MFNKPSASLEAEKDPKENASHPLSIASRGTRVTTVSHVCELCHGDCVTSNNHLRFATT